MILASWRILLDKHLLLNQRKRKNCTTSENVEQNITNKLVSAADVEKNVPNQTTDSINSNNNSAALKGGEKNSNPNSKPEEADFSKDKESFLKDNKNLQFCISSKEISDTLHGNHQLQYTHFLKQENKCDTNNTETALNMPRDKMPNNSTSIGNPQFEHSYASTIEKKKYKHKKTKLNLLQNITPIRNTPFEHNYASKIEKKSCKNKKTKLIISQNIIPNSNSQSKISMFLKDGEKNSLTSKYQTENLISAGEDIKNNCEHQSDINIDNVARGKETGFDHLFGNTKCKKKKREKGELNIAHEKEKTTALKLKKKESFENTNINKCSSSSGSGKNTHTSVSCPKVKIKTTHDKTDKIKEKTTGLKRGKNESFESASIKECLSSSRKKKRHKSNFTIEDFSSAVLGIGNKKSKNKIKNLDESQLEKYGLTKSELIQFFKEQQEEKIAEEKKMEIKILEMYHERLVDVIIPKYFSFNNSN